jgi:hypothetical protein
MSSVDVVLSVSVCGSWDGGWGRRLFFIELPRHIEYVEYRQGLNNAELA